MYIYILFEQINLIYTGVAGQGLNCIYVRAHQDKGYTRPTSFIH